MTPKAQILVAEDSATQQLLIQAHLETNDFTVRLADNGRLALEEIRAATPDLVVTDLEMPETNGLELVAALHEEFPQLPVVLITAQGSEEIAAAALRAGAASYVPKQQMASDLVPTLERILAVELARDESARLNQFIRSTNAEYEIGNDDSLVPVLIARLQSTIAQLGLADENEQVQVATALDEALVNAIIHGNLEVSSALRSVSGGEPYHQLVRQRKSELPYSDRRVVVKVSADRDRAVFVVRDDGPGFDPNSIPDPTEPGNLEKVSGRGLLLINAFMDEVLHNARGNEITMIKHRHG